MTITSLGEQPHDATGCYAKGGQPHTGPCLSYDAVSAYVKQGVWCFIHNDPEELAQDGSDFQVCGECWHVYRTQQELENWHTEKAGHFLLAEDIFACPLCAHDF